MDTKLPNVRRRDFEREPLQKVNISYEMNGDQSSGVNLMAHVKKHEHVIIAWNYNILVREMVKARDNNLISIFFNVPRVLI